MVKNNTGRKKNVLNDELGVPLNAGGLYAFLIFNNVNTKDANKTIFKIGVANNLQNRLTQYETMSPHVYIQAILANPPLKPVTRSQVVKTKKQLYLEIEKFIFKYLTDNGAVRIQSTARVNGINLVEDKNKGGLTELFYCDMLLIEDVFIEAHKKFGGLLYTYTLPNFKKETPKANDILFTGKVVFPK